MSATLCRYPAISTWCVTTWRHNDTVNYQPQITGCVHAAYSSDTPELSCNHSRSSRRQQPAQTCRISTPPWYPPRPSPAPAHNAASQHQCTRSGVPSASTSRLPMLVPIFAHLYTFTAIWKNFLLLLYFISSRPAPGSPHPLAGHHPITKGGKVGRPGPGRSQICSRLNVLFYILFLSLRGLNSKKHITDGLIPT